MRSGTRHVLALILVLAACGETPTGPPEIRLSFEGSVTSAVDGAPIQGATVDFVTGLLRDRIESTTQTDAAGRYTLTGREGCALSSFIMFAHLEAVSHRFYSDSYHGTIACTTATQTIDFVLTPWDP
jgi:hypothetical protein